MTPKYNDQNGISPRKYVNFFFLIFPKKKIKKKKKKRKVIPSKSHLYYP